MDIYWTAFKPWYAWRPVRNCNGGWIWLQDAYYRASFLSSGSSPEDTMSDVQFYYYLPDDVTAEVLKGNGEVDDPVLPFENTVMTLYGILERLPVGTLILVGGLGYILCQPLS
jgi:hypothetical protein